MQLFNNKIQKMKIISINPIIILIKMRKTQNRLKQNKEGKPREIIAF